MRAASRAARGRSKFAQRWGPYFNAYSFVLVREHEYEADRFAASVAGKDAFARALQSSCVTGKFLSGRFWPAVYREAEEKPEPPRDVLAALARALGTGPAPDDARRWREAALRRRTSLDDTHPALAERLSALQIVPRAAEPPRMSGPTAAQHYLGPRLESLVAALERAWRQRVAGSWVQRHRRAARGRTRLRELAAAAADGDVEQTWERAQIVLDLDGEEPAPPLLRDVVARAPDHAQASFALGRILAASEDESAIAHLERAMVCDVVARPAGHEAIAALLEGMGRDAEAVPHRRRAWDAGELLYRAARERGHVGMRDVLLPHGLPSDVVARIRDRLAELRACARAPAPGAHRAGTVATHGRARAMGYVECAAPRPGFARAVAAASLAGDGDSGAEDRKRRAAARAARAGRAEASRELLRIARRRALRRVAWRCVEPPAARSTGHPLRSLLL